MAKLEVLSDGRARNHARLPSASALDNKFIPSRNRCVRPINDDNNRNTNNININFGTSVENSHNNSSGDAGGRFVDVNQLPSLNNIYTLPRPQQPIPLPQPIVLQPTTDGNYEVAIREPETEHIIAEPSVTPTQPPIAKKVLIDNKRPKYVPNVARNYYAEFP